jgi:uncharacterized protein (DUF58 family)
LKKLFSIQPRPRFYRLFALIAGVLAISFSFEWLWIPAQIILASAIAICAGDMLMLLIQPLRIPTTRNVAAILSLGNEQQISISLKNTSNSQLFAEIIDELPFQLQKRDLEFRAELPPGKKITLHYKIRPTLRGSYQFGNVNIFARTKLGLFSRHIISKNEQTVAVYPSIIDMKQIELSAFSSTMHSSGIRKIRRIGHSYAFEQIKEYINGDEFRSINWKATGRRGKLMVNQYEEERSQQIFSVIDQSRVMQLPFNGLTLLDYSVNAALAISNIALRKHDKAGLMQFSSKTSSIIPAERSRTQMKRLLESLYSVKVADSEPNYELLYTRIRSGISQRSLLFLYTNFESAYALERALPLLRRINKAHLLVVIFFENTEVARITNNDVRSLEEIYVQTIARKHIGVKLQLAQTLRQHGIQTVYTRPEDLSVQVVNKYLELKSRGML